MKSTKEWAENVVVAPNPDAGETMSRLRDVDGEDVSVYLQYQTSWHAEAESVNAARGIIERLVERVQSDARAPLKEEIASLRAENEKIRAVVLAARDVCVARDWDMMSSDGDYERVLVDAISATGMGHDH